MGSIIDNVPVIFNILNEDIKGFRSKDLYWGLNYYNASKYVTVKKNQSQITWASPSNTRRRRIKYFYTPSSVTSIGNNAFNGCSLLQSITIPSSVTSIGNNAFYGCSLLQSITIPSSVTSIGSNAFQNCSLLQSITIPENVTSIGESAFYGCSSLQSITIPSSVTSIGNNAFYGCSSLQSINIPSSVTSIGNNAFSYCSLVRYMKINTSAELKSYALNFGGYSTPKRSGIIYDFSNVADVPVLSASTGLSEISYVSAIIVPDNLYDEWIAATNWVAYASKIKKVSEVAE